MTVKEAMTAFDVKLSAYGDALIDYTTNMSAGQARKLGKATKAVLVAARDLALEVHDQACPICSDGPSEFTGRMYPCEKRAEIAALTASAAPESSGEGLLKEPRE